MKMLRILRKQEGISMKALGEMIGVSESTISLYETGKREPDFETLLKLGEHFGVSVDYLLRGETAPKKEKPTSSKGDEPTHPLDVRLQKLLSDASPDMKKAMIAFLEQLRNK